MHATLLCALWQGLLSTFAFIERRWPRFVEWLAGLTVCDEERTSRTVWSA
jgi:hypothetical protein